MTLLIVVNDEVNFYANFILNIWEDMELFLLPWAVLASWGFSTENYWTIERQSDLQFLAVEGDAVIETDGPSTVAWWSWNERADVSPNRVTLFRGSLNLFQVPNKAKDPFSTNNPYSNLRPVSTGHFSRPEGI